MAALEAGTVGESTAAAGRACRLALPSCAIPGGGSRPDVVPLPKRPDPPVPAGGGCYVCGKQRQPRRSRRYAGLAAEIDPFCSNGCARDYHDNPLPGRSIWSLQP